MSKLRLERSARARIAIAWILLGALLAGCGPASAEGLQIGSRFKIIRPVYLVAVYDDVNNKRLSRETARAYLNSEELADRYFTAFQREVPAGTIMTIIRPAPKVWPLPFFASRYIVRLDPDISQGLDVELALNRGMEGSLDGLNPDLFSRELSP
jgi:hypothetical protein